MRNNAAIAQAIDDQFPADYNELNWVVKTAILDPLELGLWQVRNYPKLVPSEEEARKIGLAHNWELFYERG